MKRRNLISRTAICLYLVLALVLCGGCNNIDRNYNLNGYFVKYDVIEIDNCEYIFYETYNGNGEITHKGNCKYCTGRALAN